MDDGKARRAAIFEGTYQSRRKAVPTTIADFAPRFLQAKRHLRTVRKYRQQIGQDLAPHFGRKPLEAIALLGGALARPSREDLRKALPAKADPLQASTTWRCFARL